jgi:two-component system sensor histidine kinase PilS (NtrC family)
MIAAVSRGAAEDWRALRLLSLYRLLLITILVLIHEGGLGGFLFELVFPRLFRYTCDAYAVAALILLLPLLQRRPGLTAQVLAQFTLDIVATTIMVYANGGVSNGLGILLITPILSCATLLTPRMAAMLAAGATLALFAEEIVRQSTLGFLASEFTTAGLFGMMFFATAAVSNALAQRARRGEALAQQAGSDLANMARLNERIIESMHAGVLVVDAQHQVRACNAAGLLLLDREKSLIGLQLATHAEPLHQALQKWQEGVAKDELIHTPTRELIPHFSYLSWGANSPMLILLEDAATLREQAQQLKLAALGRLSAAIAHEIRNPLAAINHAGQLLAESTEIRGENQRLLAMIQRHGERINMIVRDVLDLSRHDYASRSLFALKPWLVRAIGQYQEGHVHRPRPIELLDMSADLNVCFDPHHLRQVLFNLLDNSFEHGNGHSTVAMISVDRDKGSGLPRLELSDNGPGIAANQRERIFEPFFTTAAEGTGLGLYLSRELCDYNQARLTYVPQTEGARFRIQFSNEAP